MRCNDIDYIVINMIKLMFPSLYSCHFSIIFNHSSSLIGFGSDLVFGFCI